MQSTTKTNNNYYMLVGNNIVNTMSSLHNCLIGQQLSTMSSNLFMQTKQSIRERNSLSLSHHQYYKSSKIATKATNKQRSWLVSTYGTTIAVAAFCLFATTSEFVNGLKFKETIINNRPRQQNEMIKVVMIRTNQTQQDSPIVSQVSAPSPLAVTSGKASTSRLASITALTLQDQHPNKPSELLQQQQQQPTNIPNIETVYMEKVKPSWLMANRQYRIDPKEFKDAQSYGNHTGNAGLLQSGTQEQAFDSPILLRTKLGVLEGVRSIEFNKRLYTFLSVPYAKAPINVLRFRAPQPIEAWKGIYQATKWPPFCVQSSMTLASRSTPVHVLSPIMNEDCLYLNIWSPSLKYNKNHKRPVMVWIHGGAFQYGGVSVSIG